MTPQIEQLFRGARSNQEAGNFPQAEMFYRQVLLHDPNNPDALHQLGLVNQRMGRIQIAVDYFGRAINAKPDAAPFWMDLSAALLTAGQIPHALAAAQEAVHRAPDLAQAHINLGNVLLQARQPPQAIDSFHRAIQIQPDHAFAYYHLGNALLETKQLLQAVDAFHKAIALAPFFPEACNNLGWSLQEMGRVDEAVAALRMVLDQVESSAQNMDSRWRAARADCYTKAHNNLHQLLVTLGRYEEAVDIYRRPVALWPSDPNFHNGMGVSLMLAGRHAEAVPFYDRAIALLPNCADYHWNLALLLLGIGDFARGWPEFEWRLLLTRMNLARQFAHPKWNNQPLAGKTILLHTEGGFGDAFHFSRYVPMVAKHAGAVIFECQKELVSLFEENKQSLGIAQVITRGSQLPYFDYFAPLQSLPLAFDTRMATIPKSVPYLRASAERIEYWKQQLAGDRSFKVGLAWAGSNNPQDPRSRTLSTFAPLADVSGVSFYSLQKGPDAAQPVPDGMKLLNPTDPNSDFAETAALMANLDLIITVDSGPAHLAAALGRPTWVLLPTVPDFRWLLDRSDSPWYPTMRLFRQKRIKDWSHVLQEIVDELRRTVETKMPGLVPGDPQAPK